MSERDACTTRPALATSTTALLGLLVALPGCDGQRQIGAFTQYTRGADGGGAGGPPPGQVGNTGSTGVANLAALFSGAQFGGGAPSLGLLGPADGAFGVALTTPIVAMFSESIDPKSITPQTFMLREDDGDVFGGIGGGGATIPAAVALDPSTALQVALLVPNEPLEPNTRYMVSLTSGVRDLEGNILQATASGGGGGSLGGVPGNSAAFETINIVQGGGQQLQNSFNVVAMYPVPGDDNAPIDAVIQLYFSIPVDESTIDTAGNLIVETPGVLGGPIEGEFEVQDDPRVVRFTPSGGLPMGEMIQVTASANLRSQALEIDGFNIPALNLNGGTEDFVEQFRVTDVPTPSSIKLIDNAPLTVDEITVDGTLTTQNVKKFKADVKIPGGSPSVDSVTLLFFQQKGETSAASRAFSKNASQGKVLFNVDLSKGDDAAAFVDTNSGLPPRILLLGAFTTRGNRNSPVGPVELPRVFVKTSLPEATLGPPAEESDPYTFRTVLGEPTVYGVANEPLTSFRAIVNATTLPATFDAIALGGNLGVTDANRRFITKPAVGALPGGELGSGPRFLPLAIDEIEFRDAIGNTATIDAAAAGMIHFEGSVGGPLEADATEALRVRVVDERTLLPLKKVEVQIDAFPFVPIGMPGAVPPLVRTTAKDGEVEFAGGDLTGFGPAISITAFRKSYDVFTVAGMENPAMMAKQVGVGIVLRETGSKRPEVTVETTNDVPVAAVVDSIPAFVASAANAGRPAAGKGPTVDDGRFFVDDLGLGTETFLRVDVNRPFIVTNVEFDGADPSSTAFATHASALQVTEEDVTVEFDYADKASTMEFAVAFASATVSHEDVTMAGITEPPADVTRARLVGTIPGLPDVLPLTFSPFPVTAGGGTTRTLRAPIPPSLMVNEFAPAIDPAHELLFQPDAGTGVLPPTDALLEQTFRFEVEAAESGSTRLTRQRVALDFTGTGATAIEAVDLPVVPSLLTLSEHPPSIMIDVNVGGSPDMTPEDSLFRIALTGETDPRNWIVLVAADATGMMPAIVKLPSIGAEPFDAAGLFQLEVTAVEFAAGTFDFDAFTFADVERLHRRLSRSATIPVDTTAP